MSEHFKYIIISQQGDEYPILFPPILDHSFVVLHKTVVAAGFVSIRPDGETLAVATWGESVTLRHQGLPYSSRPEDTSIISFHLNRPLK